MSVSTQILISCHLIFDNCDDLLPLEVETPIMTKMMDNEELIRYRKARNFIYKMGLRAETRNEHGCHIHVCNMEIKQE